MRLPEDQHAQTEPALSGAFLNLCAVPSLHVLPCSYLPGVQEAASQHLEQLEGSRKLFVAANSLSISQRQLLYAHDELTMAVLRITTRRENEQVGWYCMTLRGRTLAGTAGWCIVLQTSKQVLSSAQQHEHISSNT